MTKREAQGQVKIPKGAGDVWALATLRSGKRTVCQSFRRFSSPFSHVFSPEQSEPHHGDGHTSCPLPPAHAAIPTTERRALRARRQAGSRTLKDFSF